MSDESIIDLDVKSDKIDYGRILMRQMDRIGISAIMPDRGDPNIAIQNTMDFVTMSVSILNSYLSPYKDKKYTDTVDKLEKKRGKDNQEFSVWDKLECLVKLMHRRGLLLKKEIEVIEEGA